MPKIKSGPLASLAFLLLLGGCGTVYYETMEPFGAYRRDILVDWFMEARDSQESAWEQCASALEEFTALTNFNGGDLQVTCERLNSAFEESEDRASAVRDRIRAVERVSEDLFKEWEDELDLYTNQQLRASSAATLAQTRDRQVTCWPVARCLSGSLCLQPAAGIELLSLAAYSDFLRLMAPRISPSL